MEMLLSPFLLTSCCHFKPSLDVKEPSVSISLTKTERSLNSYSTSGSFTERGDINDVVSSHDADISFDAVVRKCRSERKTVRVREISDQKLPRMVRRSYAVTKRSMDPRGDFRVSMVEMILEKGIFLGQDLKELLLWFLALNHVSYHGIIYDAFVEVCDDLFK